MAGRFEVLRRVLVLRAVAAADVAARQALAQVHPRVADLHAIFANRDVLRMDILDLVNVRAWISNFWFHNSLIVLHRPQKKEWPGPCELRTAGPKKWKEKKMNPVRSLEIPAGIAGYSLAKARVDPFPKGCSSTAFFPSLRT